MSSQSIQPVEQYANPSYPPPITQQPFAGQQAPFVTTNSVPPHLPPIIQQPLPGQQAPSITGNVPRFRANRNGWMGLPPLQQFSLQSLPLQEIYGVPNEMYYLSTVDHLLIMQDVELMEIFLGWETSNKYTIKNVRGETVYYAIEESSWLARCCCGTTRPFVMRIFDVYRNEVIHFRRPLGCGHITGSCCCCCLQKLDAYTKDDEFIGTVQQTWNPIFGPRYNIRNESGNTVLKVRGPICIKLRPHSDFNVVSVDKRAAVGKISKQWSGFGQELFTDADIFGLSFPLDLDVYIKAVLLGACFLIDFMFYESKPKERLSMLGKMPDA